MKYTLLTRKKKRLDGFRPLPLSLVQNLDDRLRVELTYTSNAIEGNTLTLRQTALVVEEGLTVAGKSFVEHLEATNHARAIDWVKEQVKGKPRKISEKDILSIHGIILRSIDDSNAGYYRGVAVRISGSAVVFPNPLKVPDLMGDFARWLRKSSDLHPVELASEAHYRLVTIHPFTDGNGRTARLLMNMILLMFGYPPAIIRPVDRLAYIASLEKVQCGGSRDDYLRIISKSVNRSLNVYLRAARGEVESSVSEVGVLKIGELAKLVGESNSTIRYWTQEGLLDVAESTESGYHLYSRDMVDRVNMIRTLQERRLTISEIRLSLSDG